MPEHTGRRVPPALRYSAALAGCLLLVAGGLYVLGVVAAYLAPVLVPVAIALLLAALLAPAVHVLLRRRVPRLAAVALVLLGGLAVLGGLLAFVITALVQGLPALREEIVRGVDAVVRWLSTGPLHLDEARVRGSFDRLLSTVTGTGGDMTTGALNTAMTAGEVLGQAVLVLFVLVFLLTGGPGIWAFLLRPVPASLRDHVDVAGRRALSALVSYTRATIAVAAVDAVAIGIGIAVLGVPLAVPLAAVVFLCAFIPVFGAFMAGGLAVLVAFVANGPVTGLVLLGIVIAVEQVEGHVLQPLFLGRAVRLHPLAVVLSIAVGWVVAGIAGALLAVPLLAVLNAGVRSLLSTASRPAGFTGGTCAPPPPRSPAPSSSVG
ncbi:AI-2E family transporter [Amycolatopsis magusensis]|uniref:AI-2E family transporter n=1 Tax=Amycolatopsis magusensis TaxID=882444 RepID=UPI003C2CBF35